MNNRFQAEAIINEVQYECCPEKYQDMTFTFVQKRYSYTPVLVLLIPCLITAMVILLTFFLPPDSGEKIGLSKLKYEERYKSLRYYNFACNGRLHGSVVW